MEFNGASNGSAKSNANGGPKAAVARRPKANLSISGPVAWSLSLILIVWGLLLPLDHFTHKNGKGLTDDAPLLLSLRDSEQGGILFSTHRVRDAPILYGLLHTIPGMIWCILMPLQLSTSFRRRHPRFHRASGYFFAVAGTGLVVTGAAFPINKHLFRRNLAYSHPDLFHVHRLVIRGRTLAVWPSFALSNAIAVPKQAYTLYRAVKAARAKRFAEHNTWAVLYATNGYLIALARVGFTMNILLGLFFHYVAPESLIDFLRLPKELGPEAWDFEKSAFAGATFFWGGLVTLAWQRYLIATQNPVFDETKPAKGFRRKLQVKKHCNSMQRKRYSTLRHDQCC